MESPSHRIHHDETGPEGAPLVVLIHGSLDRASGMARLGRALSGTWRVLRYDRRGYGRSRPHDGPFDVASQVSDLSVLLAGRRAVLVGHSFGGHVALAAAQQMPACVAGVSVFETPLSWTEWWPSGTAGGLAVSSTDEEAAEHFMRRLIGDRGWEELPERTRAERRAEGRALRAELLSIRNGAPWDYDAIRCPTFCGFGSEGSAHHAEGMRWLARHLPSASVVRLEGAGHGAPNTHPREFARELVSVHFGSAGTSTS